MHTQDEDTKKPKQNEIHREEHIYTHHHNEMKTISIPKPKYTVSTQQLLAFQHL